MLISFLRSSRYRLLVSTASVALCLSAASLAAQPNSRTVAPTASVLPPPAAAEVSAKTPEKLSDFAQPEFPGGDAALIAFLGKTMRYPAEAYEQAIEGRVSVSFWIDEQGRAYGFGVVQSPHPSLAEEALRALRLMPDWTAGRRDGHAVPLLVHVPVMFRRPSKG